MCGSFHSLAFNSSPKLEKYSLLKLEIMNQLEISFSNSFDELDSVIILLTSNVPSPRNVLDILRTVK